MSAIKPGDRVRPNYISECHAGEGWKVVAIEGDRTWTQLTETDGHVRDDVFLSSHLVKIQPHFEVGKTYEFVNPEMRRSGVGPITIVAVNDEWAIGWWANGEPWNRRHQSLGDSWQEVS